MRSADKLPASSQPETLRPSETPAPDQILDLLLDALEQRQAARRGREAPLADPAEPVPEAEDIAQPLEEHMQLDHIDSLSVPPGEQTDVPSPVPTSAESPESPSASWSADSALEAKAEPPRPEPRHGASPSRMLARLLLAVAALIVLINIPVNRHGTPLARIMPDSAALVIRDGLVLKAGGPDIYVLQDDKLRWISSLEAFDYFGYSWPQVRVVDEAFLEKFELGRPLHVLLKCRESPHIYALENGQKLWIKDIASFEAEGYVWEDVMSVDCTYLAGLPDGPAIPEDAGPPPQP
ncbi:MAG TPA: hypothetical protein VM537_05155 [Anaerolineae bacterium]|jgi:hypothetical protein|nr:hypothetical protein [Anaerolineae bacterium]